MIFTLFKLSPLMVMIFTLFKLSPFSGYDFYIVKLVSMFVSDFNNRRLTVATLTLSDKRLIETDLLKTGFLFEFSSFPCTFDRCLDIDRKHTLFFLAL
jgi:hypothetical protein